MESADLQLVISTGSGVNGFTLDPSLGEFILTHPDIKVLLYSLYGSLSCIVLSLEILPAYSAFMKVRDNLTLFLFKLDGSGFTRQHKLAQFIFILVKMITQPLPFFRITMFHNMY